MSITQQDVKNIAHLARLGIQDEDIERYEGDLNNVLDLVAAMDKADITGVEPMSHPHECVQRLRPDEVTERDQREHFQAIAPKTQDGLYLVPKVLD